ncbi:MAG: hypothetical protein GX541_02175 [Clostridiales bacterium]|jgi:hypothetical protein|nr:hypothetical protein [Clostridiales bacterium]
MQSYHVTRVENRADFLRKADTLPRAHIGYYPWNCAYRPESYGVLGYNDEYLFLYMRSYEDAKNRRAEVYRDNGEIYQDSCLEFFFNPCPESRDVFINLEINPRRFLYLAFGEPDIRKRHLFTTDEYNHFYLTVLDRETALAGDYWDVSACIPFSFIKRVMPEFEKSEKMRFTGNFFKCGNKTPMPHYGCWSEIIPDSDVPNFYKTRYFGEILFN